MRIFSRRIPSGLDGAESCGANQKWDPNYISNGIKGWCVPSSQPLVQMAQPQPSFWSNFMSAFSTPKTVAPVATPVAPAQTGMSRNTMIALGLGAVGIIAFAMLASSPRQNPGRTHGRRRRRKKRHHIRAATRHALPSRDFAVPENEGLPIDTKRRTRNAMSRFGQYRFDSKAQKKRAYKRILARSHRYHIDPSGFQARWGHRI